MRLEIKRKLSARSDRVKSVDIHPTEAWILASLFNGNVYIWNYKTQSLVKSFEVTELPVRTAKFIARKQWIAIGADDMFVRVYNYNTMEKLKTFEAHSDYIRCIAIHPTQPYMLTSSDDMLIKLWDWDKNWLNTQIFEGHNHYVMQVVFNPKDSNTFASASLDRTIKVWGLGSPTPHFTLEGHDKGVNCVEYYVGGEKPYLISGSDDKEIKVWDYQNKTCVQTLEGHTHNVTVVCFHPTLPIIISGSEDNTIRIWHAHTYRLEKTLNYGWERVWALAYLKGSNKLAIGYDEGTIMVQLGSEEPAVSMDQSGKIIWAKNNEIQTLNVKGVTAPDGERLPLATKDLGTCEVFPQNLRHNSNGRFVVVCGDAEYIIYTALAWRNKTYGNGLDFVWASGTGEYAVRESSSKIKVFKNFKEHKPVRPNFSAEGTFGGFLLGVRSASFVCFYDWEDCEVIRKIDVCPKAIYWSEAGDLVAIACESSFYILRYNKDAVTAALASGEKQEEDGIEAAFEVLHEISERVRTAIWVGDCFIYTNTTSRLNYCIGGKIVTISHLDRQMYLLGYLPKESRIYLIDKSLNVVSYTLHVAVVNYQTAIIRGDMDTAAKLLPKIPVDQRNRIAQFLEAQGKKEEALEVSTDPDHRFDLAVQLNNFVVAHSIAKEQDAEHKWKQLGDLSLPAGKFGLAEECLSAAQDLEGLLLLYVATGHNQGIERLATIANDQGKNNVAFVCYFLLRRLDDCINLLCNTGRIPEAAFFSRTYLPSQISRVVKLWREDLQSLSTKAAESLADPTEYENLFPDLKYALKAEKYYAKINRDIPASSFPDMKDDIFRDLIEEIKAMEDSGEVLELDDEKEEEEKEEEEKEEEEKEEEEEEQHVQQPKQEQEEEPEHKHDHEPEPEQEEHEEEVEEEEERYVAPKVEERRASPALIRPEYSPQVSPQVARTPELVRVAQASPPASPTPTPASPPVPSPAIVKHYPKEPPTEDEDDVDLDNEVNELLKETDATENDVDELGEDDDFDDF